METCSNCGATLRSGAKFCTTCGTRMNEKPPVNNGWSTPRDNAPSDPQETSVLDAVSPQQHANQASISGGDGQREYDRWTSAYADNTSGSVNDPASRFISALEDQATPAETERAADGEEAYASTTTDPASTWVTPPPTDFKSSNQRNWSYQPVPEQQAGSADVPADSNSSDSWRAPSTWNQAETPSEPVADPIDASKPTVTDPIETSEPAATEPVEITPEHEQLDEQAVKPAEPEPVADKPASGAKGGQAWKPSEDQREPDNIDDDDDSDFEEETDAAGFHDGRNEVDYLSGDENIATSGTEPAKLEPNDARVRAIELVDELRRMVRMMPGGGQQDRGAAAMALTEASLSIGDFGDVRDVITELQEDPRDIQALSNLARKADKIELLLDEHASLAAAIESALKEMNS